MDRMSFEVKERPAVCPEHGAYESREITLLGKSMRWTGCPACAQRTADAEAEQRRQAAESERQKMIEARLSRAGIPMRFRGRTFATFSADTKGKADCLRIAKQFADSFAERSAEGATMVFSGLPGTGKSHLAIAICQTIMADGYTAMYLNALDAIRMVRATWSRDSAQTEGDVMRLLTDVGLLVLDEVGAQYGTEGEQVILFDIINRRYQDQMPMILLTNQGKDGFRQYLGDRAFDRLREAGRWVPFDWESHRGKS